MAIKVGGTSVIDDSRNLQNIASIDATTLAAFTAAGVGDITAVTAGSGLTGGGTSGAVTVNHADTSSQGSVNNSGNTVIQDITLDTYGHITGINSTTISSGIGQVRAWVNFRGSSTVSIRGSGNVSSISDNGTGDYTVNFSSSMPNSNYSFQATTSIDTSNRISSGQHIEGNQYNTSGVRFLSKWEQGASGGQYDSSILSVNIVQ